MAQPAIKARRMSDLSHAAAIGLDHIGIVGPELSGLAAAFTALGFHVTDTALHASGRTANRCVMLRDGGYLELMATVPGQTSATLDGFLARGLGAHILALTVADEIAARDRLRRALAVRALAVPALTAPDLDVDLTARQAGGAEVRFAVILPPDAPEGRMLLIRHLTADRLWRPDDMMHPNRAVALAEAVYGVPAPAETMARLSRLAGRPAEPDPLGGYRIGVGRGWVRILPEAAARRLFPGGGCRVPMLMGLTIATEGGEARVVHADGVSLRLVPRAA